MELVNIALATFAAALIAQVMMPGSQPLGIGLTGVFGLLALVVATVAGREIGWYGADEIAGFVGTLVSAVGLLVLYRMLFPGRRRVRRLRSSAPADSLREEAANDALGAIERSNGRPGPSTIKG